MADRDLTQGPIARLVVVLSLPVLASFGLQSLYALVNLFFVGWLGGPAVAGLSISLNTFFIVLALAQSVGTGGLALLAQAYGRGERGKVPVIFQQVVWLTLTVGVGLWAAGFLAAGPFIRAFTQDPDVIRAGVAFFRIYSATFLLQLVLMAFSYCYRAVGDFMTPTYVFAGTLVLNLALDPLLMFGLGPFPRMELAGAGYATVIAQGAGMLAYAWQLLGSRRGHMLVLRRPFTVDWAMQWRMLKIGAPGGVQYLLFTAMLMLTYGYVGPFGASASAAVGIGFRIIQSAVMPCVAIGVAVASLAGQNYGARRHDRVKSTILWGMFYTVGVGAVEAAVIALAPRFWVSLFASEPEVLNIGALYLLISCLVLPPNAFGLIATFTAQGLGRTFAPMIAVFVRVGYFIVALQVVERVWGLTLTRIFWTSLTATIADVLAMSVVMAVFWTRTLKAGAGAPAPSAPAPATEGAG
jgi:putative MATE family efflux protein